MVIGSVFGYFAFVQGNSHPSSNTQGRPYVLVSAGVKALSKAGCLAASAAGVIAVVLLGASAAQAQEPTAHPANGGERVAVQVELATHKG
jgi:hypothetical protein